MNRLRLSFAMIAVNLFSYARSGSHTLDVGAISILASAKTWSRCALLNIGCVSLVCKFGYFDSHFQSIPSLDRTKKRHQNSEESNGSFQRFLVLVIFIGRNAFSDPGEQVGMNLDNVLII